MIGGSSILYMGSPHKQPRHATKMMLKTTRTMRLPRRLQQVLLLVVVGLVLVSTEASAEEEQTAQTQASYPPFKYGATVCYACQPGNFSSSPGSPRCSRCMPGFYSKFPASSTCLPCQPSTFTPFMGSSSCLPCKGAQGFNFSTCPSTIIRPYQNMQSSSPACAYISSPLDDSSSSSRNTVAAKIAGGGSHATASNSSNNNISGFKVLDISNMDIVYRGKEWTYPEDPSAKSMVHLLRWNESLVTWLQPKGGTVEDQIPAINVNGKYRTLSLRMQKCIWKHVRLRQGFVNLESLSQGGFKLKIPTMLLCEKERTRNRFAQMRKKEQDTHYAQTTPVVLPAKEKKPLDESAPQHMPSITLQESDKHEDEKSTAFKDGKKHRRAAIAHDEEDKEHGETASPPSSCSSPVVINEDAETCAPPSKKSRTQKSAGRGRDTTKSTSSSAGNGKSLHKRIHHAVVHSIIPSIKQQQQQQQGSHPASSKTCFVVTEDDSLRKIARDILCKCPKLSSSPNRKDLLVKLLELMQEEEDEHHHRHHTHQQTQPQPQTQSQTQQKTTTIH